MWVMGGEWNIGESLKNQSKDCSRFISEREQLAWQQVKSTFGLNDFLAYDEGTYYSWDNLLVDGTRILGWLDRFYTMTNAKETSLVVASFIKGRTTSQSFSLWKLRGPSKRLMSTR